MPSRSLDDAEARELARDLLQQKKIFPDIVGALVRAGRTVDDAALVVARSHAELRREGDIKIGWSSTLGGLAVTIGSYVLTPAGGIYILAWGGILFGLVRLARGYSSNPSKAEPDPALLAWAGEVANQPPQTSKSKSKRRSSKDPRSDLRDDEAELPRVEVEVIEEPAGPQHPTSELRAHVAGLGTFDLWLRPPGLLRGRPIVVDPGFTARYAVETNDADLARAWLSSRVRRALLATRSASFRVARDQVITKLPRALLETAALRELLEATRALATGPAEIAASITRLACALGAAPPKWDGTIEAWPSFGWDLAPADVAVGFVQGRPPSLRQRAPIFTQVEVQRGARIGAQFALSRKSAEAGLAAHADLGRGRSEFGRDFTLRLRDGAALDPEARSELERLVDLPDLAAVVRTEESVRVFVAGIALDADAHRRVGAAAVKLAYPSSAGPYR